MAEYLSEKLRRRWNEQVCQGMKSQGLDTVIYNVGIFVYNHLKYIVNFQAADVEEPYASWRNCTEIGIGILIGDRRDSGIVADNLFLFAISIGFQT